MQFILRSCQGLSLVEITHLIYMWLSSPTALGVINYPWGSDEAPTSIEHGLPLVMLRRIPQKCFQRLFWVWTCTAPPTCMRHIFASASPFLRLCYQAGSPPVNDPPEKNNKKQDSVLHWAIYGTELPNQPLEQSCNVCRTLGVIFRSLSMLLSAGTVMSWQVDTTKRCTLGVVWQSSKSHPPPVHMADLSPSGYKDEQRHTVPYAKSTQQQSWLQ